METNRLNMTHKEALKVLEYHQKWRQGDKVEQTDPKELTKALGSVIEYLKQK